jgi:uncharacterized membrane protein YdbT with pleckstrin-like domain
LETATILFGVAVLALLLGLLLGRDGLILVTLGGLLAPILGIAALLFLIKRASTEFGLTDKRLVMKSGWLTTQVDEMPLGKVEAIRIEQDILGKFCGFGNLVTIGTGGTRRAFQTITEPFEFYARV